MRTITFSLPRTDRLRLLAVAGLTCSGIACTTRPSSPPPEIAGAAAAAVDSVRLLRDISILAADSMEGRGTGTMGAERARRYLLPALREAGLRTFGDSYERPFSYSTREGTAPGINLVGWVPGTTRASRAIVIVAHYDHVGIRDGRIYNGADDNASGTSVLLALARHFSAHPPRHTLIFLAADAEEVGLRGARAFVAGSPFPRDSIMLAINMDMVSRNAAGELYAAGSYHTPALEPVLRAVAANAPVKLLLGHDRPDLPAGEDWTQSSDHGPFHAAGIPFVYFGVEDHPDYHQPTDDVERIDPGFFVRATRTILSAVIALDSAGVAGPRPAR